VEPGVDGAHVAQPHIVAGRHARQHRGHVVQQQLDGACADRSQLDEYLYLLLRYISSVHYGLITLTIKTGQSINKLIPVPNLSNSNYQELLNTVFRIRIGSVFGIRIPFQESKNDPQK